MNMLFSMVVTMSITGGIVIVLVLLMRLLLARASKSSVKSRIKNIMRYKKTAAFVAVPAYVLVGTVLVALGSNPAGDGGMKKDGSQIGEENGDSAGSNMAGNLRGNDLLQENAGDGHNLNADVQAPSDPSESAESGDGGERINVSPAVVTNQMVCDIDGPVLDYADAETLIFHHHFGLFIYKTGSNRLESSVNLKELGCLDAEEKISCEIFVTRDGQKVYLHPFGTEEIYLYHVPSCQLTREEYDSDYHWEHNMDFFVPLKETSDCVDPDYTVWRSKDCVTLTGDKQGYLYLESGSGMVMDLVYVVEVGAGERVQYVRIFDDHAESDGLFAVQDEMKKGEENENK